MTNFIHPHSHVIGKNDRLRLIKQSPFVLWFTGLSGSGKSTVSTLVEQYLNQNNFLTYLLDGDNIRNGLCSDLSFDLGSRSENIRRIGEVSKLFIDAGLIVIVAFISPLKKDREMVKQRFSDKDFIEVFVDTSLSVCEKRDPKGLYKKARSGEIKQFTGIDSAYEIPESPNIHLKNDNMSSVDAANKIIQYLISNGYLKKT